MTQQVTFLPSGRTCEVETNETVLEAALRAGLAPDYGCSNGNCGKCKAKLQSGEIDQVRHHDHSLSAAEKSDGAFLMCANRALGNIEIRADVTQGPEDITAQEIETKVKGIEFLDPQVVKLHLQTPRSRRLRFISGQSVALSTRDGIETNLAIASCPCDDRNLFFHVPNIPGDPFSEGVFDGDLKLREMIRLTGPIKDSFYLDQSDRRHSLFLCWHTGFAPAISLIEHAMSLEVEKDLHLFRFSPTPDQQYLPNLARSWDDAFDNIHARLMPERITLLTGAQECQAIFADIAGGFPDIAEFNIYVSGPPNFVEAARNVFDKFVLEEKQIKSHTDWLDIIE